MKSKTPILVLLRNMINKNHGKIRHILVTDSMWDELYEELKSLELEREDRLCRWSRRCYESGLLVKNVSIVPGGNHTPYSLPKIEEYL